MAIRDIVLKSFPQFTEDGLVDEISSVGRLELVVKGEILIDLGEKIEFLPLIYKGIVHVHREEEDGREILLYYLEPGQTCATSLSCCMSNSQSTIRAEAEEDIEFISVPIMHLEDWMIKYQCWREFVMGTYALKFEELLKTVDELAFRKLDERLIHYLSDKSEITGTNSLNISHQQIAYDLNSSREVISRLLKQLEKLGNIKLGRERIETLEL